MTDAELQQLCTSYRASVILLTANHLSIFKMLSSRAMRVAELADRIGADSRATRILLDALVGLGLLDKTNGAYRLQQGMDKYLGDPSSPVYLGNILEHNYYLLRRWTRLTEVMVAGEPVDTRTEAEFLAFELAMRDLGRRSARLLADHFDFSSFRSLLDLGGGPAVFAVELCRRFPDIRVVVFDVPETEPLARETIDQSGVADRVTYQAGDFFVDELGGPYDAVLLSSILHSLGEDAIVELLRKCHAVLTPGGCVLVRDFYLEETRTSPVENALFAVNMLVNTKAGRTYTWSETEGFLRSAGFEVTQRLLLEETGRTGLIVGEKR